jgi:phosphoenolpyruvate-protein phosphotransferase (PTS system enzyme I)
MGFVTDRGGRASHTSIIARSLEIPAVLGLERATSTIRNDNIIIVDGTAGVVVINPSEETLAEAETRKTEFEARARYMPAAAICRPRPRTACSWR